MSDDNPLDREYSADERAAASALGVRGPLMWATGPYWPHEARKRAARLRAEAERWDTVAAAMEREWRR